MSNFCRKTKNPETGEYEYAFWLDDYFGYHKYGVVFPSNPKKTYDVRDHDWEFEDDIKG